MSNDFQPGNQFNPYQSNLMGDVKQAFEANLS